MWVTDRGTDWVFSLSSLFHSLLAYTSVVSKWVELFTVSFQILGLIDFGSVVPGGVQETVTGTGRRRTIQRGVRNKKNTQGFCSRDNPYTDNS